MRFLIFFGLIIALMACSSLVPANAPLQLNATAGAPIVINDEYVDAGAFTVDYPDGWRVVKLSLAGDPLNLTFASPDDREVWMQIYEEGGTFFLDVTLEPHLFERFDSVGNEDYPLYAHGQSPLESREEFEQIYLNTLASIRFR